MQTDIYPQGSHFSSLSLEPHERSRELPAIFTQNDGQDVRLFGLPEDVDQEQELDADQKLSEQFFLSPIHHVQAASAPEPQLDPFFSPLVSQSDVTDTDMSASPAAMFLSAFSPTGPPQALGDAEGEVVAGYVLGPIIGHGGFAIVRRASSPQGGTVAVKIVRRADLDKQENPAQARAALDHEAAVWASLSHEHILPLFTSSHTPYADFFVTLYCPAGSLFDILKRDGTPALPQDEAGRMYRQVVKGLRYMHEVAGFVHRDLKLENVLVDEMGVCRIGDFGMAKRIGESDAVDDEDRPTSRADRAQSIHHTQSVRQKRSRSRSAQGGLTAHLSLFKHRSGPRHRNSSPLPASAVPAKQIFQPGSLPYAAPELLLPSNSSSPRSVHTAQDIWALGIMLYALLTGRLPFADSFEPRLQMKILAGAFEMPEGIGRGAERVLQGCLERSVQDRWTVEMVDEVAWGIGWGDAGDEAPAPEEMLPPPRSRSQSRPASYPEHAVADDHEMQSPVMERSGSRSRSGRSRSRLSAFHPYQHDQHFPAHPHDHSEPSLSGLHTSILRSISSSSSSSNCLLSPRSLEPSPSAERGRHNKVYFQDAVPHESPSRSPPESPLTPVDIAAALANRGRKTSRTIPPPSPVQQSRLHHPLLQDTHTPEHDSSFSPWTDAADSNERRYARSASRDKFSHSRPAARRPSLDVARAARAESVPPHSLCSMPWSAASFRNARTAASTPGSVHGATVSLRSRSVGFDLADGMHRLGRSCGET